MHILLDYWHSSLETTTFASTTNKVNYN